MCSACALAGTCTCCGCDFTGRAGGVSIKASSMDGGSLSGKLVVRFVGCGDWNASSRESGCNPDESSG